MDVDVGVGVGVIDGVESAGFGLEEVDRHCGCWGLVVSRLLIGPNSLLGRTRWREMEGSIDVHAQMAK